MGKSTGKEKRTLNEAKAPIKTAQHAARWINPVVIPFIPGA
jgi:hypothetical protein